MNRIDKKFRGLKMAGKAAFIAYITAGDPDLKTTGRIVKALADAGVDIIELGVPFSDPVADGPTIQAASYRALKNGVTVPKILKMAASLRKVTDIPLVFMTYYNPVLRYGLKKFCAACVASGVDGIIVPDLPHEESGELVEAARRRGIATIFLVAPTSTPERIREISRVSRGFLYYVSLTGVTGARAKLPAELESKVRLVKSIADRPVAVGFGISNAAQAGRIARIADGVIVGSAIVKIVGEGRDVIPRISKFARQLARAIHNA